ncbi:peptidyl-prolyl cis-trans isomerase FKBP5-like [Echinops telfairi]|uniref:Peptidyl-prolyl cis-trans isomerase FKBP5-like n=1 Tax=Echinops telfairi TaxID=9371 RepID=A0AC55CLX1_ECHTE|nr:peptidyl-prolyl cis-trans isomerase FKBP5-like [Echinops telfairi]
MTKGNYICGLYQTEYIETKWTISVRRDDGEAQCNSYNQISAKSLGWWCLACGKHHYQVDIVLNVSQGGQRETEPASCLLSKDKTTDEGSRNNGESLAAAVADRGHDITTKKDRGVLKMVKRVGTSDENPMIRDKASVNYKGKVSNGKKSDSSHDRNEPVFFSLSKGQAMKAWHIGVATMMKGETCLLPCKAEDAYGSAGSIPQISWNATLPLETELLGFKGEDLFEERGIIQRIKQKGEGYSNPNEGKFTEQDAKEEASKAMVKKGLPTEKQQKAKQWKKKPQKGNYDPTLRRDES